MCVCVCGVCIFFQSSLFDAVLWLFQLILSTFASSLNKTRLRIRVKCVGVMALNKKGIFYEGANGVNSELTIGRKIRSKLITR